MRRIIRVRQSQRGSRCRAGLPGLLLTGPMRVVWPAELREVIVKIPGAAYARYGPFRYSARPGSAAVGSEGTVGP